MASSRPLRSPRRAGAPQVPSAYSRSTHLLDGASKPPGKPSSARLLEIPHQHFKLQRSEPAEVDDPRRAGRAFSLARPFDRSFAGLLGRGRRSLRDPVRVELFALFGRSVPDLVRVPERLLPVCLDPVPPRFPVRPTPPREGEELHDALRGGLAPVFPSLVVPRVQNQPLAHPPHHTIPVVCAPWSAARGATLDRLPKFPRSI